MPDDTIDVNAEDMIESLREMLDRATWNNAIQEARIKTMTRNLEIEKARGEGFRLMHAELLANMPPPPKRNRKAAS